MEMPLKSRLRSAITLSVRVYSQCTHPDHIHLSDYSSNSTYTSIPRLVQYGLCSHACRFSTFREVASPTSSLLSMEVQMMTRRGRKSAFTLIELLVVIAIIAIL